MPCSGMMGWSGAYHSMMHLFLAFPGTLHKAHLNDAGDADQNAGAALFWHDELVAPIIPCCNCFRLSRVKAAQRMRELRGFWHDGLVLMQLFEGYTKNAGAAMFWHYGLAGNVSLNDTFVSSFQ